MKRQYKIVMLRSGLARLHKWTTFGWRSTGLRTVFNSKAEAEHYMKTTRLNPDDIMSTHYYNTEGNEEV